jgi:hypothetical protein
MLAAVAIARTALNSVLNHCAGRRAESTAVIRARFPGVMFGVEQ